MLDNSCLKITTNHRITVLINRGHYCTDPALKQDLKLSQTLHVKDEN